MDGTVKNVNECVDASSRHNVNNGQRLCGTSMFHHCQNTAERILAGARCSVFAISYYIIYLLKLPQNITNHKFQTVRPTFQFEGDMQVLTNRWFGEAKIFFSPKSNGLTKCDAILSANAPIPLRHRNTIFFYSQWTDRRNFSQLTVQSCVLLSDRWGEH